jgi:hypothetical protein
VQDDLEVFDGVIAEAADMDVDWDAADDDVEIVE